ncbi:MAG: hypothetical protein J6V12_03985 [Bacteroidaceae bacterium]|nr:hypothetical protein [Bacteroidaceae bacterium]
MKHRIALYLFLVATLCMGCGGRISMRQLEHLEARVNDAPDSVLAMLTATDMPRWGEARALYALLTVQAQDKSYIDVADDSLISIATRYYDRKGLPLRRLQAFYYHGRVYANAGLKHEAMTAYTRAKEFVDEVDTPYPVGLLYAQMGVLYGNDYDYQQGITCMEKALNYYKLAGKERLQYIAKRDIGQFNLNMKNVEQADSLLNEVLVWGETHNDSYIIYSTINLLFCLYDVTTNVNALDTLLNKYPIETVLSNSATYSIIAYYNALRGNKAAAEDALTYAWDISETVKDTAILLHKSFLIDKVLGHTDMALQNHELLLALQDSIVRITLQQPLIASQRDHYETRLKVEELRNQQQRYLMRGAALVLLMVAIALGIYIRNCFRRKQEELNEYMELYAQMKQERETLTELLEQNKELEQAEKEALQGRIALLNRFFMANITDNLEMDRKVRQEIESLLANKEEFMTSTRMAFAGSHPQFIRYLEERGLTESELDYLCLYAIGLRGKEIGEYIQLKRHYHISSDIRKKLGIDEHETNLGIYIRKLMKSL